MKDNKPQDFIYPISKKGNTEIILKQGDKFRYESSAKSMRGWLNGMLQRFSKQGNVEYEFVFREILSAYNKFHPEKVVEVTAKQWKGKSSIEIIKGIDRLIILKYQKPSPDEEPIQVRTEVTKEELEALIKSIKRNWNILNEPIETKDIAIYYCINLNIKKTDKGKDLFSGNFWDNFFSWRRMHNKITVMLNALDQLKLIKYSGGKTELLNKDISVQLIL